MLPNPDKDKPLEITAQDTLEWHRKSRQYIARGAVEARQGGLTIKGQTLTADYHEKSESSFDIWRLTAAGDVVILSKQNAAHGDKAVYNLDEGLAIMTGKDLKMVSPDQVMTANEVFEYWVTEGRLVARGAAKVKRGEDTIESQTMTAWFSEGPDKKRKLAKAEAAGHVVITTPTEVVTGDYGVYDGENNTVTLTGHVKITRRLNALEGARAVVNLDTNVSKLYGGTIEQGRVRGVFYPESEKKNKP